MKFLGIAVLSMAATLLPARAADTADGSALIGKDWPAIVEMARGGTVNDDYVYVAMNMHWDGASFGLPGLPSGMSWRVFANTGAEPPHDVWELGQEPVLEDQGRFFMGARSVAILVGRA